MATRNTTKATAAAKEEEKMLTEPEEEPALEDKDAEIARLKAELEEANRRATYATPKSERERVAEMSRKAAEEGLDPWSVKIAMRIPRRPPTQDPWYWINVNGRSAQIPANDQVQELKLPWAEVLVNMLNAEDAAQDFADSIKMYDPKTNPHPD